MQTFKTTATFTAQSRLIAALHHLCNAVDRTQKSPADLLPIVVFMAFSIEGYLNQLGSEHIMFWDHFEKKLSWKEKVELLHENLWKKPDWGRPPLQYATELFKLRNKLAHGKPEPVNGSDFSDSQDAEAFMLNNDMEPDWFKSINADWLEDWFGAKTDGKFQSIMEYLATLHGLSPTNYFKQSSRWVYLKDSDSN